MKAMSLTIAHLLHVLVVARKIGAGNLTRKAIYVTDCSVLNTSEVLPADMTYLSVPSAGDALVADEGVNSLVLCRFISY